MGLAPINDVSAFVPAYAQVAANKKAMADKMTTINDE
jgi:hypothetical protein